MKIFVTRTFGDGDYVMKVVSLPNVLGDKIRTFGANIHFAVVLPHILFIFIINKQRFFIFYF